MYTVKFNIRFFLPLILLRRKNEFCSEGWRQIDKDAKNNVQL